MVKKTLSPSWNAVAEFHGQLDQMLARPAVLKVMDWDWRSFDDFLGKLELPIDQLLWNDGIVADKVRLDGVPRGTISYTATFTLAPERWAFPATPTHASALLVLRHKPPPDASRLELLRDSCLRGLTHRCFTYAAVCWVIALVGFGLAVVLLYLDLATHKAVPGEGGGEGGGEGAAAGAEVVEAEAEAEAGVEEAVTIGYLGLHARVTEWWINVCIQVAIPLCHSYS